MKVQKLQQALEAIKPALNDEGICSFSHGYVLASNNEIFIRYRFEDSDIQGTIHLKELHKLLSEIDIDEQVELKETKDEILLSCININAGFAKTNTILPEFHEAKSWKPLPVNFMPALKKVIPVCGKEDSRFILTCINVLRDGYLEASDNYRVIRYDIHEKMPVGTFIIPAESAKKLLEFDLTDITLKENIVYFKNENTEIYCPVVGDNYPNTESIFKVDGEKIDLPEILHEVIQRAEIFSQDKEAYYRSVEIKFSKDSVLVKSESDFAWFEENIKDIKSQFAGLNLVIIPHLFKDILKENCSCIYSKNSVRFENDDFIYVAMLKA